MILARLDGYVDHEGPFLGVGSGVDAEGNSLGRTDEQRAFDHHERFGRLEAFGLSEERHLEILAAINANTAAVNSLADTLAHGFEAMRFGKAT